MRFSDGVFGCRYDFSYPNLWGGIFQDVGAWRGQTAFTLFSHCNFPLRAKTLNPNGAA